MRTLWRVLTALAAGLAALLAALTIPVMHVHGSVAKGPETVAYAAPWWFPHRPIHASWAEDHRRIRLTVNWSRHCERPLVLGETSTAPARVEVRMRLQRSLSCIADPVSSSFLIRTPLVAEPGQAVVILVNGARFDVPRYTR